MTRMTECITGTKGKKATAKEVRERDGCTSECGITNGVERHIHDEIDDAERAYLEYMEMDTDLPFEAFYQW